MNRSIGTDAVQIDHSWCFHQSMQSHSLGIFLQIQHNLPTTQFQTIENVSLHGVKVPVQALTVELLLVVLLLVLLLL